MVEVIIGVVSVIVVLVAGAFSALATHGYFAKKPEDPEELIAPEPVEEPKEPVKEEPPPMKTNREKLYDAAYACLGIDMAPTQDYLGCAEAWSFVAKKAGVKGLPKGGILGTAELAKWLATHFTRVDVPEYGDTAIFPTGAGNGTVRGHVFIVGKHKWMSNNSQTFLWDDHWTGKEALAHYHKKGGIKPQYYRWP